MSSHQRLQSKRLNKKNIIEVSPLNIRYTRNHDGNGSPIRITAGPLNPRNADENPPEVHESNARGNHIIPHGRYATISTSNYQPRRKESATQSTVNFPI